MHRQFQLLRPSKPSIVASLPSWKRCYATKLRCSCAVLNQRTGAKEFALFWKRERQGLREIELCTWCFVLCALYFELVLCSRSTARLKLKILSTKPQAQSTKFKY